jgi:hypothetical protein
VGADCYLVVDQMIAKTVAIVPSSFTRLRVGKITGVDADGVWAQIGIGL